MVPGSLGCGSAVLAMRAMLAPSAAARLAIARPIPRLAPDMNIVLPERDMRFSYVRPLPVGKADCGFVSGCAGDRPYPSAEIAFRVVRTRRLQRERGNYRTASWC